MTFQKSTNIMNILLQESTFTTKQKYRYKKTPSKRFHLNKHVFVPTLSVEEEAAFQLFQDLHKERLQNVEAFTLTLPDIIFTDKLDLPKYPSSSSVFELSQPMSGRIDSTLADSMLSRVIEKRFRNRYSCRGRVSKSNLKVQAKKKIQKPDDNWDWYFDCRTYAYTNDNQRVRVDGIYNASAGQTMYLSRVEKNKLDHITTGNSTSKVVQTSTESSSVDAARNALSQGQETTHTKSWEDHFIKFPYVDMIIPIISEDIPLQQRDFDTNARLLFYIAKITPGQYIQPKYLKELLEIFCGDTYTTSQWKHFSENTGICTDAHADPSSGLNALEFSRCLRNVFSLSNQDLCDYIRDVRDHYWRIDFIRILFTKLRENYTDRVSAYSLMRLLTTCKLFQSISALLSTVYAIFKQQQWPVSGPDLFQFQAYLDKENITTQAIVTYLTQDSTFSTEDFPNVPVIILFSPNTITYSHTKFGYNHDYKIVNYTRTLQILPPRQKSRTHPQSDPATDHSLYAALGRKRGWLGFDAKSVRDRLDWVFDSNYKSFWQLNDDWKELRETFAHILPLSHLSDEYFPKYLQYRRDLMNPEMPGTLLEVMLACRLSHQVIFVWTPTQKYTFYCKEKDREEPNILCTEGNFTHLFYDSISNWDTLQADDTSPSILGVPKIPTKERYYTSKLHRRETLQKQGTVSLSDPLLDINRRLQCSKGHQLSRETVKCILKQRDIIDPGIHSLPFCDSDGCHHPTTYVFTCASCEIDFCETCVEDIWPRRQESYLTIPSTSSDSDDASLSAEDWPATEKERKYNRTLAHLHRNRRSVRPSWVDMDVPEDDLFPDGLLWNQLNDLEAYHIHSLPSPFVFLQANDIHNDDILTSCWSLFYYTFRVNSLQQFTFLLTRLPDMANTTDWFLAHFKTTKRWNLWRPSTRAYILHLLEKIQNLCHILGCWTPKGSYGQLDLFGPGLSQKKWLYSIKNVCDEHYVRLEKAWDENTLVSNIQDSCWTQEELDADRTRMNYLECFTPWPGRKPASSQRHHTEATRSANTVPPNQEKCVCSWKDTDKEAEYWTALSSLYEKAQRVDATFIHISASPDDVSDRNTFLKDLAALTNKIPSLPSIFPAVSESHLDHDFQQTLGVFIHVSDCITLLTDTLHVSSLQQVKDILQKVPDNINIQDWFMSHFSTMKLWHVSRPSTRVCLLKVLQALRHICPIPGCTTTCTEQRQLNIFTGRFGANELLFS